jgi:hypothetical protein
MGRRHDLGHVVAAARFDQKNAHLRIFREACCHY